MPPALVVYAVAFIEILGYILRRRTTTEMAVDLLGRTLNIQPYPSGHSPEHLGWVDMLGRGILSLLLTGAG
jgi:hypothetical protein